MKRLLSKALLLTVILVSFIFIGCSSLPEESNAKKDLEQKIAKESKGKIELVEFKKTNGIKKNEHGQEIYTLEFSALVKFTEAGYKEKGMNGVSFGSFYLLDKNDIAVQAGLAKYLQKDTQVKLEGEICYMKTENGWRPSQTMMIKVIMQ